MALITLVNDGVFDEDANLTLLQVSQKHNIPHMHVCGGNARCSTCRVLVLDHPGNLTPPTPAETSLAQRMGFEENIRLACQCHALGPVTVRRLTLDDQDAGLDMTATQRMPGREQKIAILFSDIRDFTTFAERSLPYDTVHVLNRYFQAMGEAVMANEGYIDKYIGDGMMALFGMNESSGAINCRNALAAALQMLADLGTFNEYLRNNFGHEFRVGIGIHFGEAVLGEIGHSCRRQVTAIGDAVNMASRIENATKEFDAPLLISDTVLEQAGARVQVGRSFDAMLKGKTGAYTLHEVLALSETIYANPLAGLRAWLNRALRQVVTIRRAPLFLRAAFHDAATFDAATNTGGANGALHLPEVYMQPENKGLDVVVQLLEPIKKQMPLASWADLFICAGATAVKVLGGPDIPVKLGRLDFDIPPPAGVMEMEHFAVGQLKERFERMGLSARELVALSGAHTVGQVRNAAFKDEWYKFDNGYFRALLAGGEGAARLLGTDRALLDDPECAQWVRHYAEDQAAFFEDFSAAYQKMSMLGAKMKGE